MRYRPKIRIATPPTLELDQYGSQYIADYAHRPHITSFRWKYPYVSNEIHIGLDELPFPGVEYDINVQKIESTSTLNAERSSTLRASIVARTEAVVPPHPPKSGTGCFHVYEVYKTTRKVKIYWRGVYGRYELIVYEYGKPMHVYAETGSSEFGYTWVLIGLNRHYAVLRSLSDAGLSEKSSIVDIPAQREILSPHPVHWNYTKYRYSLTWTKPENNADPVVNYTVFWVDTLDGEASLRIADFVYLSADKTSFVAEGEPYIDLGLSVNTVKSSSGLQAARLRRGN